MADLPSYDRSVIRQRLVSTDVSNCQGEFPYYQVQVTNHKYRNKSVQVQVPKYQV